MLQASGSDGCTLPMFTLSQDCVGSAKVDVGRGHCSGSHDSGRGYSALRGADLPFEISGQSVVVEQDAVFQGLGPALDLSLGLGIVRRHAQVLDAVVHEPTGQIAGNVR